MEILEYQAVSILVVLNFDCSWSTHPNILVHPWVIMLLKILLL